MPVFYQEGGEEWTETMLWAEFNECECNLYLVRVSLGWELFDEEGARTGGNVHPIYECTDLPIISSVLDWVDFPSLSFPFLSHYGTKLSDPPYRISN